MPHPLIALVSDELTSYQLSIARSLYHALRAKSYDLLCVCGGALKPYSGNAQPPGAVARNAIYDVARNYDVDGFVVLSSIIGNHASLSEVKKFTYQYTHKPLVSFGIDIPEVPSVSIDNYSAMKTLMRHMTEDQSRQRFVFVRGFAEGPISQERERAFRDELNRCGLKIDESLIIDGNFKAAESFIAMDQLLKRTQEIDAVVAANDTMALSAVHALHKHGMRIPDDVIVSGFDNTISAAQSLPAITTVGVDIEEHVLSAVDFLYRQITHGETLREKSSSVVCSANLISRASTAASTDYNAERSSSYSTLFDANSFRSQFTQNMSNVQSPAGVSSDEVIDDVVGILVNGSKHSNTRLENALQLLHYSPEDVSWWRHLQDQMAKQVQIQGHVGLAPDAVMLTTSIMSRISSTIWSVEASEKVRSNGYDELVLQHRKQLSETETFDDLVSVLRFNSTVFRIARGFLCMYDRKGSSPGNYARLAFQHPIDTIDFPPDRLFRCHEVLPNQFLKSELDHYLIVEPLICGATHLGYMVIDERSGNFPGKANFKALADSISNALERCYTLGNEANAKIQPDTASKVLE
ncbi:MAG: substrate-binding domain-containing protein [Granulosicoccus sp.]|nr:substrate-binding domain-containing protein [Granulosicoccus sp.]